MKWRYLLWPFAVIYDLITRIRNHLFDIGHKPSFKFEVPVVGVGNLNVGGSGKTPMVEYLIRLLGATHHVATLSRGYGRKTRGLRFASAADDATTIGDEPYQLFRKFDPGVKVVVSEDRALAIPTLLNEQPDVDLILLDDAFQHRSVRPHLSILLTEYERPFTRDVILPAGNLREARSGACRADVVVVTKCPTTVVNEVQLVNGIRSYVGDKPIFFSTISYGQPIAFGKQAKLSDRVVLLTGIANPAPLVEHLGKQYKIHRHFQFGDHHRYALNEVEQVASFAARHEAVIVTTEKDMVRLLSGEGAAVARQNPCFYIPIETVFLKNGSEFDELVRRMLKAD